MTERKQCPFTYESCDKCELYISGYDEKYRGCVFKVISRNLLDIKMMLREMLKK